MSDWSDILMVPPTRIIKRIDTYEPLFFLRRHGRSKCFLLYGYIIDCHL